MSSVRRVRVFISPRSGVARMVGIIHQELENCWDVPGIDLTFQVSQNAEDGKEKARRAIDDGVDTILVVGGDGMVSTIGSVLVGSPVALGVIPGGSGNGFARHFGIPLIPKKAVQALASASRHAIDVGTANGRPFFVTCSMAWDAALVRTFEQFRVRGILPYVFSAAYEFIGYVPQPIRATFDGKEELTFADPLVFTLANMTQYGGGARIAPQACPDDGFLELVVMLRQDAPLLFANLAKLFNGTIDELPQVITRRFQRLEVRRDAPAPIQVDGELVDAPAVIAVEVLAGALNVLVPDVEE
jgi:diacylglycerol kinase (ATP)